MMWHNVQYCTVLHHIITQKSYNISLIVVKAIDKKNICSCFVGLTPVLICAVCEIMFYMKAAGF